MTSPILNTTTLTLHETPDRAALARVCNHPLVWQHQRQMYASYHDRLASSAGGAVATSYFRPKYGRFYISDTSVMSATPMWASARSALFQGSDADIDAVQCHPNLLLHEMETHHQRDPEGCPPFDALSTMCSGREAIFDKCSIDDEWLALYNAATQSFCTTKDVLKSLVTIVIFGGSKKTWLRKWTPPRPDHEDAAAWATRWQLKDSGYSLCAEMDAYIRQMKLLQVYLVAQDKYKPIVDWKRAQAAKKEEDPPTSGQCLAVVLQDIEASLVLRVMQHFSSVGMPPTVYAYDGFQVPKPQSAEQQQVLDDALAHVNTFRPHATFIVKPFRPAVPDLDAVQPRNLSWDVDAFHAILDSADTDKDRQAVYGKQKAYFEASHFFVHRQVGIAEVTDQGHYKGIQVYAPDKAGHMFENLWTLGRNSPAAIKAGEPDWIEVPFYGGKSRKWPRDRARRTVQSIELYPQPGGKPCPVGCFNMWSGFEIEHTPYDPDADISRILNHYVELIPDAACREYLLDWTASKVQFPGRKLRVCPVLYGRQGAASSSLFFHSFQ